MAADIVIFATPVWWGIQSSFIQRVIERLDEVHDEIMDTGKSKLTNKVALDVVVTGNTIVTTVKLIISSIGSLVFKIIISYVYSIFYLMMFYFRYFC